MRVLITVPHLYLGGGVTSYYNTVVDHLSISCDFFEVGALNNHERVFEKPRHLVGDWIRFRGHLKQTAAKYDLIHFNPSFLYGSLIRDGVLLQIAKGCNQKMLVFFHGWNKKHARIIEKHFFDFFFSTFNRADSFIVLGLEFKKQLRDWGFSQPIYLETTPVDDQLVEGFSIEERISKIQSNKPRQILFLSRIEKDKGICETIEAFSKLLSRHHDLHLAIAGDGSFVNGARGLSKIMGLEKKVTFLGYVKDEKKKKVFLDSDIYVFPSFHGEGMPTSVLEAMAFGLPVVTTPVGGLKDFFVNGQHGFMAQSKDPSVIASLMEKILLDKQLCQEMSIAAHKSATEKFLASKVAKRLENIYFTMLDNVA